VLAIDPAYYGYDFRNDVHNGDHHNVITIDSDGPDPEDKTLSSQIFKVGNDYKFACGVFTNLFYLII
jgi:hypothetical protein